jgi:hypothetical protein
MSLSWAHGGGQSQAYITCSAGNTGAAGTGAYTLVTLCRLSYEYTGPIALWSGSFTTEERMIFGDFNTAGTGKWYGEGDGSSGFGPYNGDGTTWYLVAQGKNAGSGQTYNWHQWTYNTGGSTTHSSDTTTATNHGDGSTITSVVLGNANGFGGGAHWMNGEMALAAVYDFNMTDPQFTTLCGTTAQAFMNLTPKALWLMNVASPSAIVDATGGGANYVSTTGTITGNAADPPSFNYSLSAGSIYAPWFKF